MLDALRQGRREATTRFGIPDQDVDQGVGQFLTAEPALQESRCPGGKGQGDGCARVQDHHAVGIGLQHLLHQLHLVAREVHAGAVVTLALPICVGAYDDNGDVNLSGQLNRPGNAAGSGIGGGLLGAGGQPAARFQCHFEIGGPGAGQAPRPAKACNAVRRGRCRLP